MKMTGIELIAAERLRQKTVEGWTADHDQKCNTDEELARAAASYALPETYRKYYNILGYKSDAPTTWPFAAKWWKPTPADRVRELAKAGALIAAEIDRLQNL